MISLTLPYLSCQYCHLHCYMPCHCRSLSRIHQLNQVTLLVDIPRVCHQHHHMKFCQSSLHQFQLLIPVTLPDLRPKFYQLHYLLIRQWRGLNKLHLLNPETLTVPPHKVYHLLILFSHSVSYPIQALYPQVCQYYHLHSNQLIKPRHIVHHPQV